MTVPVLRSVNELTSEWLSSALGQRVRSFKAAPIGTGQSSGTFRVVLDWDGDVASVMLKLADTDTAVRQIGKATGHYEREVQFYDLIASRLPVTTLARCHAGVYDDAEGYFTLLLEDLSPARTGDQIAGCTLDEARQIIRELAHVVAPVAGDPGLAVWMEKPLPVNRMLLDMMTPDYFARFGSRISDAHRAIVQRFITCFDTWTADRTEPRSIIHGDFRLDNLLFGEPGSPRPLTIVDWQTLKWGSLASDLAFFIGGNLSVEDRRAHEHELVQLYHDELVAAGVTGFSFEQCWRGYRWAAFSGVFMAFAAPMLVAQTERGDQMFMTMLSRHCQQIIDTDAMTLLEQAHAVALKAAPSNEGRHEPGPEPYWNESWYLDAISADGKVGAYVRVGLVPNLNRVVYTAYIVGEGRPSVAILDYEAPLPADGLAVRTQRFRSDLIIEEPLQRFRVTLDGRGESYADPAAALRGEPGEPVDVAMDLVWETDGTPYMYQITSRYELPCRVRGTLKVGNEVLTLDGPGQRDHSWGDRNWWAINWTWVSAHLDDDTHMQGIEIRVPGLPPVAVGYEQHPAKLTELKGSLSAAYDIPGNRLPGLTRATLEPTGTVLEWEPIAYAPIRLVAPDGRVCEFPRAMARVSTADGRTGLGWLEWGHNVAGDVKRSLPQRLARRIKSSNEKVGNALVARVPQAWLDKLMNSRSGHHIVAAIFRSLPKRIDPARAEVVNATVRYHIADGASSRIDTYDLILKVGSLPRVQKHPPGPIAGDKPRVTLTLSGADLLAIGTGRLDAMKAALQRRILIEGDPTFLSVLATLLAGDAFPPQQPLAKHG